VAITVLKPIVSSSLRPQLKARSQFAYLYDAVGGAENPAARRLNPLVRKKTPRLRRWQALAPPLIIDDLVARGWDAKAAKVRLGALASIGVFAYAIGKFLSGGLTNVQRL
jgi:hypothetical protein